MRSRKWWGVARDDFAELESANHSGRKMPEVRHELLTTLKDKLVSLSVLDEFKSAGVFVNWWQQNRYDLKTIVSTGWHHTLIPDEYLLTEFFQSEADAIEELETHISELQTELTEAVETAQEVAAYEPEEDEKVTAAVIKKALKTLIDDLKDSAGASAQRERDALKEQDTAIKEIEKEDQGQQIRVEREDQRIEPQSPTQAARWRRVRSREPGTHSADRSPASPARTQVTRSTRTRSLP